MAYAHSNVVHNDRYRDTQKKTELCLLQGDGKNFLDALRTSIRQGTTGARDIQVKFKDDKEMCINSTVLSNMGQYFQVMLDCGLRETQENKVTLPTVTQSTFTRLMAFTLGRKVKVETREELLELLEAADMMQIESLVDACIEKLQAKATVNDCLDTFLTVRKFSPDKVQDVVSFIVSNIQSVKETAEWCFLEEEDISFFLKTWATTHRSYSSEAKVPEVLEAVLRWTETNRADQDTSTRLLGLTGREEINDLLQNLLDPTRVMKNALAMKTVQEWLKAQGEITLLVVGSAENQGDDCTDSYIYCWSENRRDWYTFPSPPKELPKDFAVTRNDETFIISGGMNEKTDPSDKVWTADESGWEEIGRLGTARSRHGAAAFGDYLFIVGGLPGPLNSIEMSRKRNEFYGTLEKIGDLPEAVYDCAVGKVGFMLIVVGGCSSEGPRNIIQIFHRRSHAAEVITLPESPGLQLDLGFTWYLGTLDSLLFLSRSGHLLEVKVEGRTVTLQGQILLKDFHHQAPFAAVLDSGGMVVCDSRSADCRYSLDGEKKEETTVVRRLRDDIQVHSIFRFFLPSEKSPPSRLGSKESRRRFRPRSPQGYPPWFS